MENNDFFGFLKYLTGGKKMSTADMASKIFKCSVSYLSLIKKGHRRIPSDFLNKIIVAFPSISTEDQMVIQQKIKEMQETFDRKHNREVEMKQKEVTSLIETLSFWVNQHEDTTKIRDLTKEIMLKVQELAKIGGVQDINAINNNLFA